MKAKSIYLKTKYDRITTVLVLCCLNVASTCGTLTGSKISLFYKRFICILSAGYKIALVTFSTSRTVPPCGLLVVQQLVNPLMT